MKSSYATDSKKERLVKFFELLTEMDNEAVQKVIATSELKLGISTTTALHYIELFKTLEKVVVEKGKVKLL